MSDPGFEALLEFLKRACGFDFTGYKRASLERRFNRRMETVEVGSYGDYLDFLEVHPEEFGELLRHAAHQRHELLPRPSGVGGPAERHAA